MESPLYLKWQEWDSRITQWLNQTDVELEITDATKIDRLILVVLAMKYQFWYRRVQAEDTSDSLKEEEEDKCVVTLSKVSNLHLPANIKTHRTKEKLFEAFSKRHLTAEEMISENSSAWEDFNFLVDRYSLQFIDLFDRCLSSLLVGLISQTREYQELIAAPRRTCSIKNFSTVFHQKNEGEIFLSIDIKSANFSLLQLIHAIDAQMFPTWPDFLSFFVGPRPLILQSKFLRMRYLGKLPSYEKLEALWKNFTADIYQNLLVDRFKEKNIDLVCQAFNGDEVVFHIVDSIDDEQVKDLTAYVETCLMEHSPIVKFHVQAYRLKAFRWKDQKICFGRMFIGQGEGRFDLKCVPFREKNYEQACADFRKTFNL